MTKKASNTTYISPRVKELLEQIENHPFTTIVAPMGYGKSTAALWYLEERRQMGDSVFRINVYSDDIPMFWKSVQTAFSKTDMAPIINDMAFPEDDAAKQDFAYAVNEYMLALDRQAFILMDDCHLTDPRMVELFVLMCSLSATNLHVIAASREPLPLFGKELTLGQKLLQITADDLRLTKEEMDAYCALSEVDLTDEVASELFTRSEGWFSYIYLNICSFITSGKLLPVNDDIFSMVGHSIFAMCTEAEQRFMVEMCMAGEFTASQADAITGRADSLSLLESFVKKNAFVRYLPDTGTYRFHHILRGYAEEQFEHLPDERKTKLMTSYQSLHLVSCKSISLTERELAVARLAISGKTRKEIGETLFLSEHTVRNYMNSVYSKLGIEGTSRQKQVELTKFLEHC